LNNRAFVLGLFVSVRQVLEAGISPDQFTEEAHRVNFRVGTVRRADDERVHVVLIFSRYFVPTSSTPTAWLLGLAC
jgi:hypothetical protein